jgi:hypothetical protein
MSASLSKSETVSLGKAIYAERLAAQLEPGRNGEFVAIDVESGDYEVAADILDAVRNLRTRRPGCIPYLHRVGRSAAFRLGSHSLTGSR